ncbi:MAG TPA: hypothetical protein VFP50_12250 [Anaeromyxobacteraceae bacterium]|nr:hypothetical protein [Anaeromyxobacteraceae bacterium]
MTTKRTIALAVAAAAALIVTPAARAADYSADRDHVQRQRASAQLAGQAAPATAATAAAPAERQACRCAKC